MKEIEELILLKKRYAQMRFLKELGKDVDLKPIEERINEIYRLLEKKGIAFFYLYDDKIKGLEEEISKHSYDEIKKAITTKEGRLWELLKEKSELISVNIKHKKVIASIYSNSLSMPIEEREKLYLAMRRGSIEEPFNAGEGIAKLLYLLGFDVVYEDGVVKKGQPAYEKVEFKGEVYVLDKEKAKELKELIRNYNSYSMEIQRLIALKQVGNITEEEENKLNELQQKLISLLKDIERFQQFKIIF